MVRGIQRLTTLLAWRSGQPAWVRWLAAGLLFAAALMARLSLGPMHGANPALTFYPAILLAAVLLGWQQATAVLLLSVAIGSYLFVPASRALTPVAWCVVGGLNVAIIAGLQHLSQELAAANERQRILFRELQHRVANTLQSVVGTFELTRRRMQTDPAEAARLLDSAASRFAAAAQVHRRLNDPALFRHGLDGVLHTAVATAVDADRVELHFDIEPLRLSLDQMSTITMLVIECVNNAQKHVFQRGHGSVLWLALKAVDRDTAMLVVRDDGPGYPANSAARSGTAGLGLGIIEGLVLQIGGSLTVDGESGTEIRIVFPLPGSAGRRARHARSARVTSGTGQS